MGQVPVKAGIVYSSSGTLERACVWIRDGIVESIGSWAGCPREYYGGPDILVLPQPANMHVHSADWLWQEYGTIMDLDELVAEPGGLKHRKLRAVDRRLLTESALQAYRAAWDRGTGLLVDFRELGGLGCTTAREAIRMAPEGLDVVVLGRPGPGWPQGCMGLGISSPLAYDDLASVVSGIEGPRATHIAETRRAREMHDLELALEHGFNILVHGVHLDRRDLEAIAEHGVGLVMAPRSNMWHGVGLPPIVEALEAGVTLAVGSDNASWAEPDVWLDAAMLLYIARLRGERGASRRLAEALFYNGYRLLGMEPKEAREGGEASFLMARLPGEPARIESLEDWILKRAGARLVARVDRGDLSPL